MLVVSRHWIPYAKTEISENTPNPMFGAFCVGPGDASETCDSCLTQVLECFYLQALTCTSARSCPRNETLRTGEVLMSEPQVLRAAVARGSTNTAAAAGTAILKTLSAGG